MKRLITLLILITCTVSADPIKDSYWELTNGKKVSSDSHLTIKDSKVMWKFRVPVIKNGGIAGFRHLSYHGIIKPDDKGNYIILFNKAVEKLYKAKKETILMDLGPTYLKIVKIVEGELLAEDSTILDDKDGLYYSTKLTELTITLSADGASHKLVSVIP